jgi:hypothetical protein
VGDYQQKIIFDREMGNLKNVYTNYKCLTFEIVGLKILISGPSNTKFCKFDELLLFETIFKNNF